jgi:glycogen debranching enzyme
MASLFERVGEHQEAARLRQQAKALERRMNRAFWSPRLATFGMALAKGRLLQVLSSNAGHVLWAGATNQSRASKTAKALMSKSMFAGWGIRTLSKFEKAYDPISYHLGTIWPHDNSLLLAGFRRYGFDDLALRLFDGMTRAALCCRTFRLPETLSGNSEQEFSEPVRYPVACAPQAWAAGSYPYMLMSLIGLRANAFDKELIIERPILPKNVSRLELTGLTIGRSTVSLLFERKNKKIVVTPTHNPSRVKIIYR